MKKTILKVLTLVVIGMAATVFNSCSSSSDDNNNDNNEGEKKVVKINFTNPQAIFLKNNGKIPSSNSLLSSSLEDTSLFQLTENGDVLPVLDGIIPVYVKTFSSGVFVQTSQRESYIIYLNNTYIKLPDALNYIGENEEGDLIFADASVLKRGSRELKKMNTALANPRVQSLSGNFAVIDGGSGVFQIYNTAGEERYNIKDCNGPRIVALNKEKFLIDDCQDSALMDIKTGIRSKADIASWNGEHIYLKTGALIMSQGIGTTSREFGLGVFGLNGKLETVFDDAFKPGTLPCMNCNNENKTLFVSDKHYIVKELSQVSVIRKGETAKKSILIGYNVLSISVADDKVYFIAEDKFGYKKVGYYSLVSEETILVITEEVFDNVYTF